MVIQDQKTRGRPKKEPTVTARIRQADNPRVIDAAALKGMSVPDYLHYLVTKENAEHETSGVEPDAS
jgi:hypothetical protein